MSPRILFWPVLTLLLLAGRALPAQLVINEYCASNKSLLADVFGDYPDWIELYNPTGAAVSMTGLYLSDSPGNLTKWACPAVSVGANQHFLAFASTRDGFFGSNYHTSFKLTQMKAEKIILSDGVSIIDSLTLKPTQRNHSRGRLTDGATVFGVFTTPTPGAANVNAYTRYALPPTFTLAPGFYPSAQTIGLFTPEPSITIHYTTDGSTPTAASPAVIGPINLPTTTIVRAVAISGNPAVAPSFVETNTYFINANHHKLPVVSLASSDYSGLFASNFSEIITTFEYFDSLGQFSHEGDGDIRGHGNDSWSYDQKGMRFYARDDYGYANNIERQLFDTSPRDEFDVVILKAAGSDNYPGGALQSGLLSTHLRDAFAQTLAERHQMHVDVRRYAPCVIYINGQYWGLYEIRERVDPDYADYYYDQDPDSVDMLAYWGWLTIEHGSDTAWNNLHNFMVSNNLSVPANHDYVADRLDLMSLIDYFILNTYLVNTDWLNWNTAWWRGRSTPGVKWRYRLWDEDNIYNLGQNYTGVTTTTYLNDPCNPTTLFPGDPEIFHTDMLNALMADTAFNDLYINRYADLLNTALHCDTLLDHLQRIVDKLSPEMPQHCARWGGSVAQWNSHLDSIRVQINGRCRVVDSLMVGCYNLTGPYDITVLVDPPGSGDVRVNTVVPTSYPYVAGYYGGVTMDLAAVESQSFPFVNWTLLHHSLTPGTAADSVRLQLSSTDTIIAHFDTVVVGLAPALGGLHRMQVYPTLATDHILLAWQVPSDDPATALWLTDLSGRRIADLSAQVAGQANGRIRLGLEGLRLAQGMYFVTLKTAGWAKTEKVMKVGE